MIDPSTDVTSGGGSSIPSPDEHVRRTVLPNGLRIVTDRLPTSRSVAASVWVGVGGRDESDELSGASHFLEHLLFKGTADRDAKAIAVAIDAVGGDMNAFTANEHTAYYARVPAAEAYLGIDLLLDVVQRPALRPYEFDGEREVILEELAAADDDPDDVASVKLFECLFPEHPLGREVLGSAESIEALDRDRVASFFEEWYTPANIVVAAAGDIDHDVLVEEVARRFGERPPGRSPERTPPGDLVVPSSVAGRPVESMHLAMGWRALSVDDEDRFALALLNHVFGSGPSSRLFQEVREDRGLTYSISSGVSHHVDTGALTVHCATATGKVDELIDVIDSILDDVVTHGISREELARAKGSLRGAYLMSYEDVGSRMTRLGMTEIMRGGVTPIDEHLARLEAVTDEDVRRVAERVFGGQRVLSTVGPG
ncbi:M16 family metallopeptidase [Dermatobacter hominis]|uniref:M16 family metallopeptidase n=1 Tax=Dermatobacter hominis TaxID=2884263 RepID=UPI001D130461|nr:pitrilysin family protein [Dermatobacter hominis]UDY36845.1 insulinase family protein [Dermatobacter hominis]